MANAGTTNRANHGWTIGRTRFRRPLLTALAVGIMLLPLMLTATAQAQSFSVIYNFSSTGGGETPEAGSTADSAGNFYGTTALGGAYGCGTVYELPATGGETAHYSFTGGSDGAYPCFSKAMKDSRFPSGDWPSVYKGYLYGTTSGGGSGLRGVAYKLKP